MNAMLITHKYKILRNKKPTYKRLVCDIRLQKTDFYKQFWVRLTIGTNLIHYDSSTATTTAEMLTIKILWNSLVSASSAKYIAISIKDFYLANNKYIKEYK